MTEIRQVTQMGNAEVAASNRTPLLDDLVRSIHDATLRKSRKRSF